MNTSFPNPRRNGELRTRRPVPRWLLILAPFAAIPVLGLLATEASRLKPWVIQGAAILIVAVVVGLYRRGRRGPKAPKPATAIHQPTTSDPIPAGHYGK